MNAATEFDLGPLTWVKGEIDLALERAEEAFGQYLAEADVTKLKFCRTHVHQVHGALSIVGLDGITQVTESLESLLEVIEDGRRTADEQPVSAIRQAITGIRAYLDELMAGEPNQPLRLLPLYRVPEPARGKAATGAAVFRQHGRATCSSLICRYVRPRERTRFPSLRRMNCIACSRTSAPAIRKACSSG